MFNTIMTVGLFVLFISGVWGTARIVQINNMFIIDPWLGERMYRIREDFDGSFVPEYTYWWYLLWCRLRVNKLYPISPSEDDLYWSNDISYNHKQDALDKIKVDRAFCVDMLEKFRKTRAKEIINVE